MLYYWIGHRTLALGFASAVGLPTDRLRPFHDVWELDKIKNCGVLVPGPSYPLPMPYEQDVVLRTSNKGVWLVEVTQ